MTEEEGGFEVIDHTEGLEKIQNAGDSRPGNRRPGNSRQYKAMRLVVPGVMILLRKNEGPGLWGRRNKERTKKTGQRREDKEKKNNIFLLKRLSRCLMVIQILRALEDVHADERQ